MIKNGIEEEDDLSQRSTSDNINDSIRKRREWEYINESLIEDTINNDESIYTNELYSEDARVTFYNETRRVAAKLSNQVLDYEELNNT